MYQNFVVTYRNGVKRTFLHHVGGHPRRGRLLRAFLRPHRQHQGGPTAGPAPPGQPAATHQVGQPAGGSAPASPRSRNS